MLPLHYGRCLKPTLLPVPVSTSVTGESRARDAYLQLRAAHRFPVRTPRDEAGLAREPVPRAPSLRSTDQDVPVLREDVDPDRCSVLPDALTPRPLDVDSHDLLRTSTMTHSQRPAMIAAKKPMSYMALRR